MKKILSFTIVFLVFFELISIFFTNLELFIFNEKPKYSYEKKFLHDWIEKDEDGIVWHKRNYKTRHISRCFDVEYETNNVGARDYNDYFKSDQIASIMLIGDSFAEGPGVKINKIFAKILEKKINKKVLNFGNSGTKPETQLTRYLKYNKDYNFDELIYFFLPQNDYSSTKSIETKKEIKKNSELINFGILKYAIVDFLARFTYPYNFIRSLAYSFEINFDYGYEHLSYFYNNEENIDYTFKFLEKIINSRQLSTFVVIIPTIYDINNFQKNKKNYKELYWYKQLAKILEKNNSTLIDLMDYIEFDKKALYFHSCDGHWSEYGNLFAANVFLKYYNKIN